MEAITKNKKRSLAETNQEYYKYYLEEKKRDLRISIISWLVIILLTGGVIFLMFKYLDAITILGIGILSPFALMVVANIFNK